MRFTYIGNPRARDDRGSMTAFGIEFPLNVPVEVTNETAIRKLSGNDHFRCEDAATLSDADEAEEAPVAEAPKPRKARKFAP